MVNIIVAITKEGIIGRGNDLPWHLPEDLKMFRRLTLEHPVIMGRKTYDSIGRPLPKRRNMVISRTLNEAPEGTELFGSLEQALSAIDKNEDVFIIGGAQIYALGLDVADRLYISRVQENHTGDTYFPVFSEEQWSLDETEDFGDFILEIWNRKN